MADKIGQPGTGCVLRLRLRSNNNDCSTAQPRGGWNIINSLILWVAESGNPGLWAAPLRGMSTTTKHTQH